MAYRHAISGGDTANGRTSIGAKRLRFVLSCTSANGIGGELAEKRTEKLTTGTNKREIVKQALFVLTFPLTPPNTHPVFTIELGSKYSAVQEFCDKPVYSLVRYRPQ